MKKCFAIIISVVALTILFSIASAYYVSYNTTTYDQLLAISNTLGIDHTITYNTRPTDGQGGVHVGIYEYIGNNEYVLKSGKQFPYYQSVSPMTSLLPNGEYREMIAKPIIKNQHVQGNVTYSTSY